MTTLTQEMIAEAMRPNGSAQSETIAGDEFDAHVSAVRRAVLGAIRACIEGLIRAREPDALDYMARAYFCEAEKRGCADAVTFEITEAESRSLKAVRIDLELADVQRHFPGVPAADNAVNADAVTRRIARDAIRNNVTACRNLLRQIGVKNAEMFATVHTTHIALEQLHNQFSDVINEAEAARDVIAAAQAALDTNAALDMAIKTGDRVDCDAGGNFGAVRSGIVVKAQPARVLVELDDCARQYWYGHTQVRRAAVQVADR